MAPPPFRAEQVGSLLRPRELKDANARLRRGEIGQGEYDAVLEAAIAAAVRMQEEAGLHSISDGEFARSSWFGFFFERMSGFALQTSAFRFRDEHGDAFEWPTCQACARIRRERPITVDEYRRLRGLTARVPKITMPSPSAFHFFRLDRPADPTVYPDTERYWEDLVAVYRAELADLIAAGCGYIQFDEVPLAMLCDTSIQEQVRGLGGDPEALIDRYVDVLRQVVSGHEGQAVFGLHLCRGNFRSRWMAAGGYEPVAERLFNGAPVDTFFLEYDTPRAGGFEPLRHLPRGKTAVLGLVSTKTPEPEAPAELARRIDEAARFVPLDRLALSPQCGFASVAGGNSIGPAEEAAKLRLVAQVAAEVWR